jgi:uncharacterized protein with FMN-binding domain
MAQGGSNKKVANSLVALSCGAVLAVYSAGYVRTRSAANQFEAQAAERRPAAPVPERTEAPVPVAEVRDDVPRVIALPPAPDRAVDAPAAEKPRAFAVPEHAPSPAEVPVVAAAPAPAPVETPVAAPPAILVAPVAPLLPALEHKAEAVAAAPAAPKWKDGTYHGWGTSRHGDIEAEVVIAGGRIASAIISQCRTRYPCSVIENLPPEVAQRQSPEVDYVSRATQSTNAFYYAVVEALGKAK